MTDMTKCRGEGCPHRDDCWRYLAPASYVQAWADFDAQQDKPCSFFVPIEPEAA